MGFFDRFKKQKQTATTAQETKEQQQQKPASTGKRIKKYTSEGKPIYD